MRIIYSAYAGGDLVIPDSELDGKSKEERDIYINTVVGEKVAEEAGENFEWEESDD